MIPYQKNYQIALEARFRVINKNTYPIYILLKIQIDKQFFMVDCILYTRKYTTQKNGRLFYFHHTMILFILWIIIQSTEVILNCNFNKIRIVSFVGRLFQ